MLLELHTGFTGGRERGLVLPSLRISHNFVVIYTGKGFSVVNEAEVAVFLTFSSFSYDSMDICNLISGSSALSKSSLYIWKFLDHILLKSRLKDFEHTLLRSEISATVPRFEQFFGIALLFGCNENYGF